MHEYDPQERRWQLA